jgi:hypothetical protein
VICRCRIESDNNKNEGFSKEALILATAPTLQNIYHS